MTRVRGAFGGRTPRKETPMGLANRERSVGITLHSWFEGDSWRATVSVSMQNTSRTPVYESRVSRQRAESYALADVVDALHKYDAVRR